ncbi:GNAT family N-acetyltransferase [Candidatus Nomurabacteria bacterium]|nr:GNAT family N-acetyltransferase [Candidatus Nomurabacteria bacterium]
MITISKPIPEDSKGIHEVMKTSWYATYPNTKIGITKEDGDVSYTPEVEKKQIEVLNHRAENPKDDDISLVAKFEEKVLGYIRLKLYGDNTELISLYVHPDYFGNGIGTDLWKEALKFIPKEKPVFVEVADYTKAVEFYKKVGFVDTGERYSKDVMPNSGVPMPLMKMVYTNPTL